MSILSDKIKRKLLENWREDGSFAEALESNAEARVFDLLSCWECYLIAINPLDEREGFAIILTEDEHPYVELIETDHILSRWNGEGEFMELDEMFVPRRAKDIFNDLRKRYPQ